MKINRKIPPFIILLLLAFAQIIDTSSVTKFARRQIKRKNAMRFSPADLQPSNTMAVWEAFKSGTKRQYIEMAIGFIGAWDGNLAGAVLTVSKIEGWTSIFLPALEAKCITQDKLEGSTPLSEDMRKVAEKGMESFGTAEIQTDEQACQAIGSDCNVATESIPARAGLREFAAKAFGVFEGIKNFKDCFITTLDENKQALGDAGKKLRDHLYNWLSLSALTTLVKFVLSILTAGASKVVTLTVNIIRFGVILYRAVKKWKDDGAIAFPMVGTLFGLIIKTIFDIATSKKRRFKKK